MLSIVTWKWGTLYSVEYVNRLLHMLRRHLHIPFRLFCITDDWHGMHPDVTYVPMDPDVFPTFPGMTSGSGKRANFRRLRTFDRELASLFGPRVLLLDLDVVIMDDVTPLFSRTEPLLAFDQRHNLPATRHKYNTSMVLMDAGILSHMWTEFLADPAEVWDIVKRSRVGDGNNSDQAVFCYYALHRFEGPVIGWGEEDGVQPFYKVRNNDGAGLPPGTRAVLFFGDEKPHQPEMQKQCPWIVEHWR